MIQKFNDEVATRCVLRKTACNSETYLTVMEVIWGQQELQMKLPCSLKCQMKLQ